MVKANLPKWNRMRWDACAAAIYFLIHEVKILGKQPRNETDTQTHMHTHTETQWKLSFSKWENNVH